MSSGGNAAGRVGVAALLLAGCGNVAASPEDKAPITARAGAAGSAPSAAGTAGAAGGASGVSGADSGGSGGSGVVAAELNALAAAYCSAARACCPAPQSAGLANCEFALIHDSPFIWVTNGVVKLDETRLSPCISALQAVVPGCVTGSLLSACSGVIPATKRIGEKCQFSLSVECGADGEASCVQDAASSATGTCTAIPHTFRSGTCDGACTPDTGCPASSRSTPFGAGVPPGCFEADGLVCTVWDPAYPGDCSSPIAEGGECSGLVDCAPGDYCVGVGGIGPDFVDGHCERAQLGAPCSTDCGSMFSCLDGVCVERRFSDALPLTACYPRFLTF